MIVPMSNTGAAYSTQFLGVVSIGVFAIIASTIGWILLKMTVGIRVSEEDELTGLDKSELGIEAYPEFTR